ncbi:hypothetical protein TSAR_002316 [Trichomalopsis sarcophagae]|uniref:Uncharacterized protein n=1 Tax=Trichomalopsis sarcophagae TaxID=543379 RepID=A0A232F8B4_9HYME|nr:hypothetical protein TSAR_002316 [Trichomalopsis sarcophagae]
MYPRFILLFVIVCCCIVFAVSDEKEEPLAKCRARCNRLYVKHRTDQKGKQTCYDKCTGIVDSMTS